MQTNDYRSYTRSVKNIGHWGNGDYEVSLNDNESIDYLLSLIKQSYIVN